MDDDPGAAWPVSYTAVSGRNQVGAAVAYLRSSACSSGLHCSQ
jgi:hypothetical protein